MSHCVGKEIYCVDTGMAESADHKVSAQVMMMTFHAPAAGGPAGPKEDQETVGSDSPGENQAGHVRPSPRVYSPAKCTHADFAGCSESNSDSGSGYENPPVAHYLKSTDQGEDDNDDVDNDDDDNKDNNDDNDDDNKDNNDDNDDDANENEEAPHKIDEEENVMDGQDDDGGDEEEAEVVVCVQCGHSPCLWDSFGNDIYEMGTTHGWLEGRNAWF